MKTITIGDLHGSTAWKKINPEDWDCIIFMGDYVDSFEFTDNHILKNLLEVIAFRKEYPTKVVLLLGNHDLAYFFNGKSLHLCSGFRRNMLSRLHEVFSVEKELFMPALQLGNHLWTHAGVVGRWYKHFIENQVLPSDENLAFTIDRLFGAYYLPLFHVSNIRGGYDKDGGIFWADLNETWYDPLSGVQQIIGHTKVKRCTRKFLPGPEKTSITYVDCLESKGEFFELDIPQD